MLSRLEAIWICSTKIVLFGGSAAEVHCEPFQKSCVSATANRQLLIGWVNGAGIKN